MLELIIQIISTLISSFIILSLSTLISTEAGRIWLYKQFLKMYPKSFRSEFGDEMLNTFCRLARDSQKEAGALGVAGIAIMECANIIRSAIPMRTEATTAQFVKFIHSFSLPDSKAGRESARDTITNAIIGLIVAIAFRIIINIVASLVGFASGHIFVLIINTTFWIAVVISLLFVLIGAIKLATAQDVP